ncbi:MAG: hypothetical protein WB424_07565 [Terracidiphilus sp.]
MNHGLSDQVRAVAVEKYIQPAILAGKLQFSVSVRDLMRHLQSDGFPERNWPQVCTALQKQTFLRENGLKIASIDGPPKKQSSTVVVRYQVTNRALMPAKTGEVGLERADLDSSAESPSERAYRLTEKLRGLLKEELAEYGGGEAFLRWVRGYDEDEA